MNEIDKCPVCGIERINGTFYWSNVRANGKRDSATPDEVYSKVCGLAKSKDRDITGCINTDGKLDEKKSWEELTNEAFQALVDESSR